jgi:hypothetical protein
MGTSHEDADISCQDASGWRADENLTCLAVADGAGSRPRSRQGATLAVDQGIFLAGKYAGRDDPATWLPLVFEDVRQQIIALAAVQEHEAGDYATTVAVAVVSGDLVCVGQVGDSIVVFGHDGQYETVAPEPAAEYVNETTFITDYGALDRARYTVRPVDEVDAIFLSTDGLRFKILADLSAATPFVPFFEDVEAYLQSSEPSTDALCQFLGGLDDQSGDDKTLVAAVRVSSPPGLDAGMEGPTTTLAMRQQWLSIDGGLA